MSIKENLIRLRKSNKISQEKLAELVGVSRQAVSKWENGLSNPDTENLIRLSEIFNVSLDEITKGKDLGDKRNENLINNQKINWIIDRNKLNYVYLICSIIGLMMFVLSISYVEKNSIWMIIGIVGMSLSGYFMRKFIEVWMDFK